MINFATEFQKMTDPIKAAEGSLNKRIYYNWAPFLKGLSAEPSYDPDFNEPAKYKSALMTLPQIYERLGKKIPNVEPIKIPLKGGGELRLSRQQGLIRREEAKGDDYKLIMGVTTHDSRGKLTDYDDVALTYGPEVDVRFVDHSKIHIVSEKQNDRF